MALADWLDRIGGNFQQRWDAAGPQGLAQIGAAIASAPRGQGLAGLAQGLAGFGAMADKKIKQKGLADALSGAMDGLSPQQQAFLKAVDPEQAASIVGSNLFKPPTEKWEQVDTNGDGVPDRQKSSTTGRIDDIPLSLADRERLASAGRSNVTVNNIPPEMGARIGLGEGFLRNFKDIKARAQKFYGGSAVDQVKRRGQVFFNTGEGGKLWRDVETGKEALVRQLTGNGMATAEAEAQASRYSLSPLDTDYDAQTKLDGLYQSLIDTARGAYAAKGGAYTPPKSNAPKDNSDVDAILGLK